MFFSLKEIVHVLAVLQKFFKTYEMRLFKEFKLSLLYFALTQKLIFLPSILFTEVCASYEHLTHTRAINAILIVQSLYQSICISVSSDVTYEFPWGMCEVVNDEATIYISNLHKMNII